MDLLCYAQAASGLENLKVGDSPAKKLNFESVDKENVPVALTPVPLAIEVPEVKKQPVVEEVKPGVAPTIKETEADEPLLQENPHRFVLFPIKYHEVCRFGSDALHAFW